METIPKQSLKIYLPLAGLIPLYLITRLMALTALPISSHEATWIHWAQIVAQYPNEWLIAVSGGQQPLFTWLNAVTLNIFPDPLAAGRWVSVLAGLASVTGLYFVGRDAFNRTVGFLAGLIYIVVPYAYFFDRLALPDGLLLAFGIWTLRWSLHIIQETKPNAKAFKILGMLMGAALLTHVRALFLLPILVMVFYFWRVHQRPEFWKRFGICVGIAFAMNLPVLLNASYPASDRLRAGKGINSGTGVREAAQFLAKEAEAFRKKTGVPLPVLLPMRPGNPAEGITVYLWNHPDVRFVPVFWWPKSPRMIPTGLRFSHRPSIYQTSPVMRRETTLLDYAHFIFPDGEYTREKFLQENPRFKQAWIFQRPDSRGSIVIFKNHPKK
jgi:Dolichyl-phosphate-mannose-protein mannosyltransferase